VTNKADTKSKAAEQNRNERPSVLGRLREKQELLAKAEKKEVSAPEKKPERDMQ
jgi:hypothetical protein